MSQAFRVIAATPHHVTWDIGFIRVSNRRDTVQRALLELLSEGPVPDALNLLHPDEKSALLAAMDEVAEAERMERSGDIT